jgi:hypothetical protein
MTKRISSAFDGVIVGWISGLIFWYIAINYLGVTEVATSAYLSSSLIGAVCGLAFGIVFSGFIRDSGIIAGAIIGFLIGLAGLSYTSAQASQVSSVSIFETMILSGGVVIFRWAINGIIPGATMGGVYNRISGFL